MYGNFQFFVISCTEIFNFWSFLQSKICKQCLQSTSASGGIVITPKSKILVPPPLLLGIISRFSTVGHFCKCCCILCKEFVPRCVIRTALPQLTICVYMCYVCVPLLHSAHFKKLTSTASVISHSQTFWVHINPFTADPVKALHFASARMSKIKNDGLY